MLKVELPSVAEIQTWAGFVRDAVVVLGVPVAGVFIAKLYSWQREVTKAHIESLRAQTRALEAQNKTLEGQLAAARELQFDRQAALVKAQKEIFEHERTVMLSQAGEARKAQREIFDRILQKILERVEKAELSIRALQERRQLERSPVGTNEGA